MTGAQPVEALFGCPCCRTRLDRQGAFFCCGLCGRCFPLENGLYLFLMTEVRFRCTNCLKFYRLTSETVPETCSHCQN